MNELEQYRNELKKRQALTLIFVILGLAFSALGNVFLRANVAGTPIVNIITVAGIIFELICVGYMGVNLGKMRNDEILQAAYIRENDEREAAIRMKSGRPVITVLSMVLVGASLIVGAFSITAFITLQSAAAFQLIATFALTGYWSHKL
ncbi:uncharacterized protein YacL [Mobiluncus mulieris]|uniref:Uncharacterized protein n=1 Tax=Mobiluncus mulieris TaxID=2052 RepID=A0A7Y0U2I5_9ACTO|nr:hypothetical protein [Mobiluncus mulieris]MBB5846657.1 uncharacterized protein YacL [Mobiluncus mulieris]MCV0012703.1 hypothetical protein [Mobiluncus mulieris]NMW65700.1 hypothetical protein [Mobiluncus mulieris]NMX12066.1 hypothetical protein [Mobiluncus mulieris]PNL44204.1 hypothetical protein CEP82_010715 [Mobiluncus mulieris]